eukprot:GFUD01079698.1.p1 GENE.GFUD01079698.1~~GFUD01079698.1.p1  ORF type:complete len:1168 (+),score=312.67 GFUD01079698.1:40-3543(+)
MARNGVDTTPFSSKNEEAKLRGQFWIRLASMGEKAGSEKELLELLQEWTEIFDNLETTEERQEGLDMISNIKEILYSTSTMESQAKERGQEWSNLGRKLFQEHTGSSEVQMAIKLAMDFSPWSPAPWTSHITESLQSMSAKVRQFNTITLLPAWKLQAHPTHPAGMVVKGRAVMEPDEGLPLIDFFTSKEEIEVQARFSNGGKDDRSTIFRGCSLKMRLGDQVLDLVFNTGSVCPFENYLTFVFVAEANKQTGNDEAFKKFLLSRPANWYNVVETLVKAPSSYSRLQYYIKFPLLLTEASGVEHYCKFRIVPAEEGPLELMPEETQRTMWNRNADKDDKRPIDYLRREMKKRLSEGTVQFKLEVISKEKTGNESNIFFHPSSDWKQPWKTLALINLTETVDDERMWWGDGRIGGWAGNPGDLPPGLSIIEPVNSQDANWINWARSEIYRANSSIRNVRRFAESKENVKDVKYIVTVTTSDIKYSGTDDNVSIIIVGDKAATNRQYLDTKLYNDFERGDTTEYSFLDREIGNIEYIIMKKEDSKLTIESEWCIEKVVVAKDKSGYDIKFPFFQWLNNASPDPLIIASNRTCLPQNESEIRSSVRLLETSLSSHWKETKFKWSYDLKTGDNIEDVREHLPGFLKVHSEEKTYDELDSRFQWAPEHYSEYKNLRRTLAMTGITSTIKGLFDPINTFEEYKDVVDEIPEESAEAAWMDNWDSDEEFGRQTMNGMHPVNLHRIKELPEKFPVTEAHMEGILQRGLTLQEEIEKGNMYMIDLKILDGISTGTYEDQKLFLAVPMVLFYLPPNEKLIPVAIQLGQLPGTDFPIWTPNDTREDWLLAKFWFRNADAQVSQLVTHLAQSHFILEPFAVGMFRSLSLAHPIHKLMKENLKSLIAIDTKAREVLITPGGVGDVSLTVGHGSNGIIETLTKAYQNYSYKGMNYKNDLVQRDVMELPGYHHRDDSIKLWDATLSYMQDMVNHFYDSDSDVIEDWEVQAWVKDVFNNGFGKMKNLQQASIGVPSSLATKDELVEYLQTIFYTTVRHAFVDFYFFEYTRFAPNSPTVLRGKLPREEDRGLATMETLLASLPTKKQAYVAAATSKVLTTLASDEVYLRETPNWMFLKEEPRKVFEKFVAKLDKIEEEIKSRNKALAIPYTVLQPSRITAGVSI